MSSFYCDQPISPFVVSGYLSNDTSRLPSYRPSHLARYHPYARKTPSLLAKLMAEDEYNPYENARPAARRSSFALTTDILENAEIEIVVEATSVRLFVEQFTTRNRKFRIVADYFAASLAAMRRKTFNGVQPKPEGNKGKRDLVE